MLQELHPHARRHLKLNFVLGVINGAVFSFGDALQDTSLVLSIFVSRLSGSNVLVGFLQPIRLGGWFLLQLLLSGRVQSAPAKLPYYHLAATIRVGAAFGMAISAFTVRDPGLLLSLVLLCLAVFSLSGGLSGLAFMDIVAKTIPSRMRGSYFAWRMFLGGILALAGSFIVRYVLSDSRGIPFPRDYATLFLMAATAIASGMIAFACVREPVDGQVQPRAGVLAQLKRASHLPKENRTFRYFLLARIFLMVAEIASPFYIIYGRDVLGLPESSAGTYLMVVTLAGISSTYLWGRISDRVGSRAVLRLSCLMGFLTALSVLAIVPTLGLLPSPALPAIMLGVAFAFLGALRTGVSLGGMNFILDLAPAHDRSIYIGFTNTLIGVASMTNVLGGVVVDTLDYRVLFAIALLLYVLAVVSITKAAEPRSVSV